MRTDKLDKAFHEGLDLPADTDLMAIRYEGHPHWDSLGHLSLIVALEEAFGIEFDDEEVLALDSYGAVAELVAKKKVDQL
jgi:acyl carrier protein